MESLEKSGYGSNSKNQGSRSLSSGLGLKRKYKCNCRGFHCWPAEGTLSEQIGFGAEAQPEQTIVFVGVVPSQLTLEQRGFELQGPTYMWMFSNKYSLSYLFLGFPLADPIKHIFRTVYLICH